MPSLGFGASKPYPSGHKYSLSGPKRSHFAHFTIEMNVEGLQDSNTNEGIAINNMEKSSSGFMLEEIEKATTRLLGSGKVFFH